MRIVKMSSSDKDTQTIESTIKFFNETLMERSPQGRFNFRNQIGKNNLDPDETLIFTYKCTAIYFAKSMSEVLSCANKSIQKNYLVIDVNSLSKVNVPISRLQNELEKLGLMKNINAQGWVRFIAPGVSLASEYEFYRTLFSNMEAK